MREEPETRPDASQHLTLYHRQLQQVITAHGACENIFGSNGAAAGEEWRTGPDAAGHSDQHPAGTSHYNILRFDSLLPHGVRQWRRMLLYIYSGILGP